MQNVNVVFVDNSGNGGGLRVGLMSENGEISGLYPATRSNIEGAICFAGSRNINAECKRSTGDDYLASELQPQSFDRYKRAPQRRAAF